MSAPERITYLARRHPSFATREEWVPRWRQHWALAAAQPESATVRRYAQGEVLLDDADPPHDAVAFSEYVSPEARVLNRTAERYHAIMSADEALVFDRLILECAFFGTHHVLAGTDRTPFAVVRFLRGVDSWDREPAPLGGMLGYAQTRALRPPLQTGGLAVDGCEEFRFGSLDDARSGFAALPDPAGTAGAVATVLIHEVVLRDG